MPDFDVIIVGGRPAGASLAARLGKLGRRVLVLERADLPSAPSVPSCPTLHMGTLALLDELGLPEASYAAGSAQYERFVLHFGGVFTTTMTQPEIGGRTYGHSIDRAVFDLAMWDALGRYPSVTRRQFSVTELVKDGARVIGVTGRAPGGEPEHVLAPWVVGADGRFSLVAQKAGAVVVEEQTEQVSTVYFADWEGLPATRSVVIHTTGRGLSVLMFPLPGGRITVCTHQRADRVDTATDPADYYHRTLRSIPAVAEHLREGRVASRLLGMKRVGNGYRTAGGDGWLLAGDAFRYKDPVDGQGIYDALLGTRILAEELERGFAGEQDAPTTVARYTERVRAATHPMYVATQKRLATELYSEPPRLVIRTLLRWMLTDPVYQARFIRFLGRELDPATWQGPALALGCVARGLGRDVARLFGAGRPALTG